MDGLTRPHETDVTIFERQVFGFYTIFEGTSEIQRLIIARAVSGIHIR
jgi:alkylation response protein AidB-like acyl-CoA dehydrogenase